MSDEDILYNTGTDTDTDTDTEDEAADYPDQEDEPTGVGDREDDLFGDISDLESNLDDEPPRGVQRTIKERLQGRRVIDQLDYNIPKFSNLEPEEQVLPFTHILSPYQEWELVEDACLSGFRDVAGLSKVRNAVIRLVADAADYALQRNKALLPDLNKAFVVYAAQRGL
jgi:hypothetical protein